MAILLEEDGVRFVNGFINALERVGNPGFMNVFETILAIPPALIQSHNEFEGLAELWKTFQGSPVTAKNAVERTLKLAGTAFNERTVIPSDLRIAITTCKVLALQSKALDIFSEDWSIDKLDDYLKKSKSMAKLFNMAYDVRRDYAMATESAVDSGPVGGGGDATLNTLPPDDNNDNGNDNNSNNPDDEDDNNDDDGGEYVQGAGEVTGVLDVEEPSERDEERQVRVYRQRELLRVDYMPDPKNGTVELREPYLFRMSFVRLTRGIQKTLLGEAYMPNGELPCGTETAYDEVKVRREISLLLQEGLIIRNVIPTNISWVGFRSGSALRIVLAFFRGYPIMSSRDECLMHAPRLADVSMYELTTVSSAVRGLLSMGLRTRAALSKLANVTDADLNMEHIIELYTK